MSIHDSLSGWDLSDDAVLCPVNPIGHQWNGLGCRWCPAARTPAEAIVSGLASRRGGDRGSACTLLDAYRAEILAEAKIEVVAWLVKKAREERAGSTRHDKVRADVIAVLASKVERGAIRPNNLRMLPASFFEPGRSYVSGTWQFRCEAITPSPGTGEIRALGWKRAPVHDVHLWHAVALDPDDWAHGGWTDVTKDGSK
ncbi:MAG TPA: hypothetical protein VLK35_17355 [Methylomirabilota bacterium]|nr:hypothetical protein [Methylomirabilota bacterium]